MTFAELKAELAARGFNMIPDVRLGLWINMGRAELDRKYLWPYREKSVVGDPPIQISDLGTIEAVMNTSSNYEELQPITYREVIAAGELVLESQPFGYYVANPDGIPAVVAVPESGDSIGVQYYRVTPDLVQSDDEPISPADYHGLIVDLAAVKAYRDNDEFDIAAEIAKQAREDIEAMREALFTQQIQGPDVQVVRFASEDW